MEKIRKIQEIATASFVVNIPKTFADIFNIEKSQKVKVIYDDENERLIIDPNYEDEKNGEQNKDRKEE